MLWAASAVRSADPSGEAVLSPATLARSSQADASFNPRSAYSGERVWSGLTLERALLAGVSPLPEPDLAVRHELTIAAMVLTRDGQRVLAAQWRALPDILSDGDITALQELWIESLQEMVK